MKYLVIGNGVDLAHGLKTGYKDFLNYAICRQESLFKDFTRKKYELDYIDCSKDKNFKDFLQKIDRNVWMYYFVNLYKENLVNGENWIDFETEICHIIQIFDKKANNRYEKVATLAELNEDKKMVLFYNFYARLYAGSVEDVSKQTYKTLIENISHDLNDVINAFEIYLKNEVECADIEVVSPDIESLGKVDGVLSFNYTTTLQRAYSNLSNVPFHFIHGKLGDGKEKNNMVIGVNEYWSAEEADFHTDYNFFKKFTQRVIKNTGVEYRKWIYEATKQSVKYEEKRNSTSYKNLGLSEVYIFGHSLDISDKDLLEELFMNESLVVNVYYRNEIHQADLIAAIVRMISEKEFIKQYHEYPQRIKFIKQQDMIKK